MIVFGKSECSIKIGKRFRKIRKILDKNSSEFCSMLGVGRTVLSQIENGVEDRIKEHYIQKLLSLCRNNNLMVSESWIKNGTGYEPLLFSNMKNNEFLDVINLIKSYLHAMKDYLKDNESFKIIYHKKNNFIFSEKEVSIFQYKLISGNNVHTNDFQKFLISNNNQDQKSYVMIATIKEI